MLSRIRWIECALGAAYFYIVCGRDNSEAKFILRSSGFNLHLLTCLRSINTMRLLVIEDEEKVSRLIVKSLIAERFAVDVAADGARGLELAGAEPEDRIICNLTAPEVRRTDRQRRHCLRDDDGS